MAGRSTYDRTVWKIVWQIPPGRVSTYGQIASMIPVPPGMDPASYLAISPRWVGYAMNAVSFADNPTVPWHRVINSKGGISLEAGSRPATIQRQRLEAEGIAFDSKDFVDFDVVGWEGPPESWLRERDLHAPHSMKSPPSDDPQQLSLF